MLGEITHTNKNKSSFPALSGLALLVFLFVVGSASAQYNSYSLAVGESDSYCVDIEEFKDGVPDLYEITCPKIIQESSSYTVDLATGCVNFTATSAPGIDTICIQFCNTSMSTCEQANIIIASYEAPLSAVDTIYRGMTKVQCALNFPDLTGAIISLKEICGVEIPPIVNWSISANQQCLNYEGVNLGMARACLEAQDDNGVTDTIFVEVFVRNPEAEYILTEIEEGATASVCFEELETPGTISATPIDECGVGTAATAVYDEILGCFTIEGIEVGSTFSCFVFCDDLNICDTVELDIQVVEREEDAPIGEDDSFTATVGEVSNFVVCANDLNVENMTSLRVIPFSEGGIGPFAGTISASTENCELMYEPYPNACSLVDSLIYEICVEEVCDRARVLINIECGMEVEGLKVMNGFSPNGDGTNETLWIGGLDDYPEHTLSVFNRWGAQIFIAENYQNDWAGTWDGVDLPDGVYYYLFDTGEGTQSSGWIYVQR